ncbi:sugar ABC transporter substrate-binding protein [Butyrivibrio sp. XPD2006]|uniref:sugar ABC transporter substrate-binding protein n=1 Tax=Butyrivibrio sp. XPD2006 TaxID=1280668 RepID=UPI0003F7D5E1|nr:substrate-binding domain-containing protein [Butyrivibrio sp. XPD2006]
MKNQNEVSYEKKIVRQYLLLILTLVFMLVTLVAGSLFFKFYRSDLVSQAESNVYDKYFVMITDNYKSDFWQSVYKGAFEKAKESNIYVDLFGEQFNKDYSVEELMEIAIASKVDGIIVYANETLEMSRVINKAVDAGIPVVTLYGDCTRSDRLSFIGVGSYSIGKVYGGQIIDIIKEKRREELIESETIEDRSQIKITVLANADTQDSGQNIIISSIQDTINQDNVTNSEFAVSIVTVDNTNSFSVEESIRDIFLGEEIPDVIVCLNELSTVCTYQAVVDFNMVGEVSILGYYDSEAIVSAIERGGVYATISIDAAQMGEYSVTALTDYHDFGNISEYYLADVTLINQDNVEQFKKEEGDD